MSVGSTSLFEEIPNLKKVQEGEAPAWLLAEVNAMDDSKLKVFESFNDVPSPGIKFVNGVAAAGKSRLLHNVCLGVLFGGSDRASGPHGSKRDSKQILCSKLYPFHSTGRENR